MATHNQRQLIEDVQVLAASTLNMQALFPLSLGETTVWDTISGFWRVLDQSFTDSAFYSVKSTKFLVLFLTWNASTFLSAPFSPYTSEVQHSSWQCTWHTILGYCNSLSYYLLLIFLLFYFVCCLGIFTLSHLFSMAIDGFSVLPPLSPSVIDGYTHIYNASSLTFLTRISPDNNSAALFVFPPPRDLTKVPNELLALIPELSTSTHTNNIDFDTLAFETVPIINIFNNSGISADAPFNKKHDSSLNFAFPVPAVENYSSTIHSLA